MAPSAFPTCPNCDYDLRTQVQLQHPDYTPDGTPIEIHCDDCGHTSVWPRVTPDKAPRMTGLTTSDVVLFCIIFAVLVCAIVLIAILG
ncbi:MAG: hypothetical protein ACSHX5_10745 [Phycisphaerales bacterium]